MAESKQTLIEFFGSRIERYDSFANEWEDPDNIELAKKIRHMYDHLLKKLNKERPVPEDW